MKMQRHIVGFLGIVAMAYFCVSWIVGGFDAVNAFLPAVCMRLGIVGCAIWLAVPDFKKLFEKYPAWLLGAIALLLVTLIFSPRIFPIVAGMLAVVGVLTLIVRFLQLGKSNKRKKPRKEKE